MLKPVEKVSLTSRVFEQLRDHILSGELSPGEELPSERQLCELLAVNRSAVREALKRLEQAGLVSVQHGGKTRVRDYRRHGSLALLPALVGQQPDRVEDAMVLRATLLPEAARAAAQHARSSAIDRLEMLAKLLDTDDLQQRHDLAQEFWDTVVDASDNLAFRLAYNAIRDLDIDGAVPSAEGFADLANALAAGDTRGAALTSSNLVSR